MFRVSFPQVFEAKAIGESTKKKFGLVCLFNVAAIEADPKEKKLWLAMKDAVKKVAAEKWPKGIPANIQSPWRKGEEKEQFQGYGPGVIFISASTTTRPGIVNADMSKILEPSDFYAGCWARATVNPYAWSFMAKNGVSFGLQNIQKIKDDEAFGGRSAPEEDFDGSTAEDVRETVPGADMLD
jgi:hypothetical protein